MQFTTLAGALIGSTLVHTGIAGYVLSDDYTKDTFFGNFSAFTAKDPTNGFVNYIDYANGASNKIIQTVTNAGDASYLGVDLAEVGKNGRNSMRISSKKAYNHGLFILDLLHMPASACGSWPAFWLLGPNWPSSGEVDILEGANGQAHNQMTLHTSTGCSIGDKTGMSGTVNTTDCGPSEANIGCAITASDPQSFGTPFNKANGGVYATEWTAQSISIWFFPRASIPKDISSGTPDPGKWGKPQARFGGTSCPVDAHFKDMNIVFNTAFCGDWAGKAWAKSGCAASTGVGTCEEFVQKEPEVFRKSFWLVNYVRVFQQQQGDAGGSRLLRRGRWVDFADDDV